MGMIRNGVDVERLTGLIDEVKENPSRGKLAFRVVSEWKGGFRAQHETASYTFNLRTANHLKNHTITTDEPPGLLGGDAGISPAETLLSSLAACLSVGYAANAAAMGIDIQELRFDISAQGDIQGFMNMNGVRPGLGSVLVKTHIRSNAPREKIKELHDYVNAHSPIWDTIANPVKFQAELVTGPGGN